MTLALLGLIPYLLTGYLFMQLHLSWSQNISLFAALILTFHFAGFYILRTFSDELVTLVKQSDNEDHTCLPLSPQQQDTDEIFRLKKAFNQLLQKLEDEREKFNLVTVTLLKEARKNSKEYERRLKHIRPYVDQRVIQRVMNEQQQPVFRSEQRRVCVLFVDICSFTRISEELQPDEVVELLNDFFNKAVGIIYQYHGVVDKFIGDAIMATFGLTQPLYQVSVDAICAALELQDTAKMLSLSRQREGKKTFKIRIGINTGDVIVGDIGSLDRMDYTVIGDTVNVASRMADHAGAGGILISKDTFNSCPEYFKVESKGHIQVKNRQQPIESFAVIEKNERAFKQHELFLTSLETMAKKFSKLD